MRSKLFVSPVFAPELFAKALASPADALCSTWRTRSGGGKAEHAASSPGAPIAEFAPREILIVRVNAFVLGAFRGRPRGRRRPGLDCSIAEGRVR